MSTLLGRLSYGPSAWQRVDLYEPERPPERVTPVVLVHGGFWRHDRTAQDLEPLACALVERGHRVAVVEYRPSWDGGAWPAAADDCRDALHALGRRDGAWDGATLVGHSAGAHLLLCALTGTGRRAAVVLLAPVTDLAEAARSGVGGSAVDDFLTGHLAAGGTPEQASPEPEPADVASLVVVEAEHDQAVPRKLTEHQISEWCARGLPVTSVTVAGARHMHLVNPRRPACADTVLPLLAGTTTNEEAEAR
ncbi:hypothetical protein OK074_5886 [Actinobacteria bacterium OK074]|nr:hypothetical protein OK074_5886 [Actinobacteria bacterium OK074]